MPNYHIHPSSTTKKEAWCLAALAEFQRKRISCFWNAAPTHTPCSWPLALSRTRKGLRGRSPCRVTHGHSGPMTSQTLRCYRYLWRGKMLSEVYLCVFSCSVLSDSLTTPWTAARQAPLSMGFSRKEY